MKGRLGMGTDMRRWALLAPMGCVNSKHTARSRRLRRVVLITLGLVLIYLLSYSSGRQESRMSELKASLADNAHVGHNLSASAPDGQRVIGQEATKERRLPQALIIGSRKSGTRALLRFLEVNPAIKSAPREVHFFDRDPNYARGLEWYRNQMPETEPQEVTIEKSPAYFVTLKAPERVKAMNASIKLVLILRNPVTRLISDFSQTIANRLTGSGPHASPEDYHDQEALLKPVTTSAASTDGNLTRLWLEAESEFQSHILRPDGGIDDRRRIVRVGMYSMHLERWLSVFPRRQFHFVDGEKLIARPYEELQKLERFLGLTPSVICKEHFVFSQKKGFYCLKNSAQVDLRNEVSFKSNDTQSPRCLGSSKGRRHVAVKRELINRLEDFYAPYNEYLESMTGLKFNV